MKSKGDHLPILSKIQKWKLSEKLAFLTDHPVTNVPLRKLRKQPLAKNRKNLNVPTIKGKFSRQIKGPEHDLNLV